MPAVRVSRMFRASLVGRDSFRAEMIDSSGYKCTEDGAIFGVLSAAKDGLISAVLDARSRDGVHNP